MNSLPIPPLREFSWSASAALPIVECDEPLVPVSLCPERVLVRSQYFFEGLDGACGEIYLRRGVWERLLRAARRLPASHRLVVLDGWRSVELQARLFELYKAELSQVHPELDSEALGEQASRYVARSDRTCSPSPHSTGGAVDLTVASSDDGLALEMGSDFDETSPRSATLYYERLAERGELSGAEYCALENRRMLFEVMTAEGFTNYPDEWWHFDFGNQNWAFMTGAPSACYGRAKPRNRWS